MVDNERKTGQSPEAEPRPEPTAQPAQSEQQPEQSKPSSQSPNAVSPTAHFVKITKGANDPVIVPWQQGDTVASVLKRAKITIDRGRTATIASCCVRKPAKTKVQPGEHIVIAGTPSNG